MNQKTAIKQLKELERMGGARPDTNFRVAQHCPIHGMGKNSNSRGHALTKRSQSCTCNDAKVGVGVKKMRLAAEGWGSEWKTLVAVIMSARTRDETTIKVAEKLFRRFPTAAALASASAAEAGAIIRPINFYRNKTKNVIAACRELVERFGGKVPHDIEKLVTIPGVGRKTANVFLSECGHDAIGVDTHVSYISQKLGWAAHKDPYKIEKDLEKLFPRNYWSRVNRVCVRFGKTFTSRRNRNEILSKISNL